ncbi:hypothetical protein HEP87_01100 [Streptomyces sp. S1D4-11]|nr:hypothetical protein [Streptomyces sp. S1D4-11]QIY93075.1 hypothetical protein HEP87_01100 [Streptomyces sp. S1D4-11]
MKVLDFDLAAARPKFSGKDSVSPLALGGVRRFSRLLRAVAFDVRGCV